MAELSCPQCGTEVDPAGVFPGVPAVCRACGEVIAVQEAAPPAAKRTADAKTPRGGRRAYEIFSGAVASLIAAGALAAALHGNDGSPVSLAAFALSFALSVTCTLAAFWVMLSRDTFAEWSRLDYSSLRLLAVLLPGAAGGALLVWLTYSP